MSLRFALLSAAIATFFGLASGQGLAAEHVVKMMNDNGKGEYMVFEPSCRGRAGRHDQIRGRGPVP